MLVILNTNKKLEKDKRTVTLFESQIICYFIINEELLKSWKDVQKEIIGGKELTEQRIKQILNLMVKDGIIEKDKLNNSKNKFICKIKYNRFSLQLFKAIKYDHQYQSVDRSTNYNKYIF